MSEPKRSMASCHVMPGIGPGRSPVTASAASSTASEMNAEHVVLVDEAGLDVELHELELAVGPQVLVPQAAGDLEVAVDAADHQQLLEELRALGQRVEAAGLEPATARRTRGRPRASASMSIGVSTSTKPWRSMAARMALLTVGPDAQVALHALAAQVDVAVAEAHVLVGVDAVGRPGTAAARPR